LLATRNCANFARRVAIVSVASGMPDGFVATPSTTNISVPLGVGSKNL
jgi:hypothetical protein